MFIRTREHIKTFTSLEEELERSKEVFIKDHRRKYKDDFRFPPVHKSLEITSLGTLSKLYGNLKPLVKSKDIIAKEFGTVNHTFLPSWLQSFTQIRNLCAHHSRLWNKNLPGKPNLLPKPPFEWLKIVPTEKEFHMIYIHICCMKYLLNAIEPDNNFTHRMEELLTQYPNVDLNALGFKINWKSEPLWTNRN